VKRAARQITIHSIDVLEAALPDIRFRVSCSSGTYIRTLAHDVGEKLQCGAHLTALMRTRIGIFSLEDAHSLEQLTRHTNPAMFAATLIPMDRALAMFPAVTLNAEQSQKITHGMRLELPVNADDTPVITEYKTVQTPHAGQICRLYTEGGIFLGLGQWIHVGKETPLQWILQPRKVLVNPFSTEKP
jgi:tRNA U55 pseudouridine synthase TruB